MEQGDERGWLDRVEAQPPLPYRFEPDGIERGDERLRAAEEYQRRRYGAAPGSDGEVGSNGFGLSGRLTSGQTWRIEPVPSVEWGPDGTVVHGGAVERARLDEAVERADLADRAAGIARALDPGREAGADGGPRCPDCGGPSRWLHVGRVPVGVAQDWATRTYRIRDGEVWIAPVDGWRCAGCKRRAVRREFAAAVRVVARDYGRPVVAVHARDARLAAREALARGAGPVVEHGRAGLAWAGGAGLALLAPGVAVAAGVVVDVACAVAPVVQRVERARFEWWNDVGSRRYRRRAARRRARYVPGRTRVG